MPKSLDGTMFSIVITSALHDNVSCHESNIDIIHIKSSARQALIRCNGRCLLDQDPHMTVGKQLLGLFHCLASSKYACYFIRDTGEVFKGFI